MQTEYDWVDDQPEDQRSGLIGIIRNKVEEKFNRLETAFGEYHYRDPVDISLSYDLTREELEDYVGIRMRYPVF
jgi:hypothetical protein